MVHLGLDYSLHDGHSCMYIGVDIFSITHIISTVQQETMINYEPPDQVNPSQDTQIISHLSA